MQHAAPTTATTDSAAIPVRHPLDPEPVRCSKAGAVLALGIAGAVLGLLLGGVIPATVGLLLARSAKADMVAANGYLTGARMVRVGSRLAWIGIVLAITTLVVAAVFGLLHLAATGGTHYAPGTN